MLSSIRHILQFGILFILTACFSSPGEEQSRTLGNISAKIELANGQSSTTSTLPIHYKVSFDSKIVINSFKSSSIQQSGSATAVVFAVEATSNPKVFNLRVVSAKGSGTIIPSLSAKSVFSKGKTRFNLNASTGPTVNYVNNSRYTLLSNISNSEQSSNAKVWARNNNRALITAESNRYGNELYWFDHSSGESSIIKDINPGNTGINVLDLKYINANQFVFISETDTSGKELWVSDGTESGTQRVSAFNSEADGIIPVIEYDDFYNREAYFQTDTYIFVHNSKAFIASNNNKLFSYDGSNLVELASDQKEFRYVAKTATKILFKSTKHSDSDQEFLLTDGSLAGTAYHNLNPTLSSASNNGKAFVINGVIYSSIYNESSSQFDLYTFSDSGVSTYDSSVNLMKVALINNNLLLNLDYSGGGPSIYNISGKTNNAITMTLEPHYISCSFTSNLNSYVFGGFYAGPYEYQVGIYKFDKTTGALISEEILANSDTLNERALCAFSFIHSDGSLILATSYDTHTAILKENDDGDLEEIYNSQGIDYEISRLFRHNDNTLLFSMHSNTEGMQSLFQLNISTKTTKIVSSIVDEQIDGEVFYTYEPEKFDNYYYLNLDMLMGAELFYLDENLDLNFTENFNKKLVDTHDLYDLKRHEHNNNIIFVDYTGVLKFNKTTYALNYVYDSYNENSCSTMHIASNKVYQSCADENGDESYGYKNFEDGTSSFASINGLSPDLYWLGTHFLNDKLFFVASDSTYGNEWRYTDFSSVGVLKDIVAGSGSGIHYGGNATVFKDKFVFARLATGSLLHQIWLSDGTSANTSVISSLPDYGYSYQSNYLELNDKLYLFRGKMDSTHEIWNIDGTTFNISLNLTTAAALWEEPNFVGGAGDYILIIDENKSLYLVNISTNSAPSLVATQVTILDKIKFDNNSFLISMSSSSANSEIWKLNGSTGNFSILKEINSDTSVGSSPKYFTKIGSNLYFTANDGVHGNELWVTDGTSSGTVLYLDILDGVDSSNPAILSLDSNYLTVFFSDIDIGTNLYNYRLAP